MASTIKVDRIQSDTGTVNLASNLAFSSAFSMSGPVTLNSPTIATPTMTGQAVIPSINLTSGQIVFPATQNPSAGANTLDDYEEGTWTPTVTGNATYTTQSGQYTKIGNLVFIKGIMTISSIGTGSPQVISGLPFSSVSEFTISLSKLTNSSLNFYSAQLRTSGPELYISAQTALDGTITVNQSFMTNSTEVQFSGFYTV